MKTASFFTYFGPGRISIARYAPRGMQGFRVYRALAPGRWFNTTPYTHYVALYSEQLAKLNAEQVRSHLIELAAHLNLRTYGKPIVHAPGGAGKDDNAGFDAFIPLIDSGISLYVWSRKRFFAVVLFTCKSFDLNAALQFTRKFFAARDLEHRPF